MGFAPIGVLHDKAARLFEQHVMDVQRRSERTTRVARGRLDVYIRKRRLAQDATVGDAVQRNAARQAQLVQPCRSMGMPGHLEDDLLRRTLNAGCDVRVALVLLGSSIVPLRVLALRVCGQRVELRFAHARGTEQVDKLPVVRMVGRVIKTEIVHVQAETAVIRHMHQPVNFV